MSREKLVRMANQIATFFKTQPRADASASVANHLRDYWDPRMRAELQAHVQAGGEGLDPVVIAAARQL
jgi:formate dehydrogenase subunit delta